MPDKKTEKEYEEIGRAVTAIFESGAISKKELYKSSFIKGVFSGFGGVIGATLVIAILLWLLSLFTHVPLVGRFADRIEDSINTSQN